MSSSDPVLYGDIVVKCIWINVSIGTVSASNVGMEQPQMLPVLPSSSGGPDAIALRGRRLQKYHSGLHRKKSSQLLIDNNNNNKPTAVLQQPPRVPAGINTDLSLIPEIIPLQQPSRLARPVWPKSTPTIPVTFYKDNSGRRNVRGKQP